MTLNEKFEKATDGWIVSHACEEIADDYAIEFAEWISKEEYVINGAYTTQELLEMFKKEKRL